MTKRAESKYIQKQSQEAVQHTKKECLMEEEFAGV